jgi:2-polyprenyl-3-methyl-5-hydroxy-6-metoxy-1,4-benzoquinol methylase
MPGKLTKDEETTQKTYDRMARQWVDEHGDGSFWKVEMAEFNKYLPAGRILDVGAGSGRDTQPLLAYGYDYLGVDYSQGMLEQARRHNPGIEYRQMSIYDLSFDERFDGFWCAAVFVHIPKERTLEALKAVRACIKPGGIGFISTKEGAGEGLEARRGVEGYDRLITYWQEDDFVEVLRQAGFEVVWQAQKQFEGSTWLTFVVKATPEKS